jgi:two-component system nitrogen regulation response regulator GlnG
MVTSFSPAAQDAGAAPAQGESATTFDSASPAMAASSASHPASGSLATSVGADKPRSSSWESDLEVEALSLLATDRQDVWDVLTSRFETCLIQAALATTRGRRIEAALKLGIGRNTITRKIQELGIED